MRLRREIVGRFIWKTPLKRETGASPVQSRCCECLAVFITPLAVRAGKAKTAGMHESEDLPCRSSENRFCVDTGYADNGK